MIDPETRDIVQTIYVRKVERKGNELWNVEFDKFENVKDPGKRAITGSAGRERAVAGDQSSSGVLFDGVAYGSLLFLIEHRPVGDDGPDELRQPGARRLRDGGRLRRASSLMNALGVAVPRDAAAGLRRAGAGRRGARAHALPPALPARRISTRCCSRSASCSWRSPPPPISSARRSSRSQLPAFLRGQVQVLGSISASTACS